MINLQEYEYKAPSYERKKRAGSFEIDVELEKSKSRYYIDQTEWKSKAGDKDEISMLLMGDLLCQENMISAMTKKNGRFDFTFCFEYLRPLFKAADFVAGNLETPISEESPYRGEIITHEGPFYCNAPLEYLDALKYAGFDMLTTANNHTLDAGAEGLCDTIDNCEKYDFIQTGTFTGKKDKFVIVNICGFKVGFTAFGTAYNQMDGNLTKEGRITLLNTYTANRASSILKKMRAQGAEYTICFPHWGNEYTDVISERQNNMAKELTEMGYDFVVGSHSHVLQKFEYVNGKPVAFSLGNIISHINLNKKAMKSQYPAVLNLTLKRVNGKIVSEIGFIPCRIVKKFNKIPFTIIPANNNLDLNENAWNKLENTVEEVKAMLNCDDSLINLDYDVDKEALSELKTFEEELSNKLGTLKAKKKKAKSEDKEEEEHDLEPNFIEKMQGISYAETRIGKYRIKKDYAELDCIYIQSTVVNIDKEVEDKQVKAVMNSKDGNDTARIVYLGKFVTDIKKRAFSNFSKLESVRFFESVEKIEEEAFANCPRLTGLTLPSNLKSIGKKAFADCPALLSVKIPASVEKISKDAFEGSKKVTIYCAEGSYADNFARKNNINVKYMPL